MGKNNRRKHRSPELARKSKKVPADEYYRCGPLEIARFGKNLVAHSSLTEKDILQIQERAVVAYPKVVPTIDETISKIVELIRKLPPKVLLNRAYWEHKNAQLKQMDVETEEQVNAMKMLEYIQCIIVSQDCFVGDSIVSDSDWDQLKTLIESLYRQVTLTYPICKRAVNKQTEGFDDDLEEFRFKSQLYWCNVRGKRYTALQIKYFRYLLILHNDIFKKLFGIDVESFLCELKKIIIALSEGHFTAFHELKTFQQDSMTKFYEKMNNLRVQDRTKSDHELMEDVVIENGWKDRISSIQGKCFQCDLFDLSLVTDLPQVLLNELSWGVGENKSFFAEGDLCGWPLRVLPVFDRPFVKIDGHFYCFELHSVFDNLYRILQEIILRLDPSYIEEWKIKQTQMSESLPLSLLGKLMPNAQVLHSIYYGKKGHRKEVDGLVLSEDHLFIIEVKGGAFARFSPATDFESYLNSIKTLVQEPAEQGRRFLDYFESQKTVDLFNSEGRRVERLTADDWVNKTICCVTLDPFTHIAAQVQSLKGVGIDVGEKPIWQISLDDLLVYVDMFDNPLVFLHYMEQRNLAFECKELQLNDELDHLGLYLEYNAYSIYVAKVMRGKDHACFDGFTSDIDNYYAKKLIDPNVVFTQKQAMPNRFKEIISFLGMNDIPNRRLLASTLLNCADDFRNKISSGIDNILLRQKQNLKVTTLSLNNINLMIICWQEGVIPFSERFARDQPYIAMLAAKQEKYLSVGLFFNMDRDLVDISIITIKKSDIPPDEIFGFEQRADAFRNSRFQKENYVNGKIGRNASCPCGSGVKFKKCCGKSD